MSLPCRSDIQGRKKQWYRFTAAIEGTLSYLNEGIGPDSSEVRSFERALLLGRKACALQFLIFAGHPVDAQEVFIFTVDEESMEGRWAQIDPDQSWPAETIPSPD